MKRLLFLLLTPFSLFSQDIKKVDGVTDTNIKKVSGVSDTNIKKVNGVTLSTFTGLLDSYSGAGVAYSVRKLDKDYAGYCMRIKRLSDNSTLDIGFDSNGDLDESAITTFCAGSVDATVTIWYDQSGNGYDLTPNVGNNTLLICDNGVVLEKNSRPSIASLSDEFINNSVDLTDLINASSQTYIIGTYTHDDSSPGSSIVSTFDFEVFYVGTPDLGSGAQPGGGLDNQNSYIDGSATITNNTQYIIEYGVNSTTAGLLYLNGVNVETSDNTSTFAPTGTTTIYVGGTFSETPCKELQEVIIWPLNQSSNRSSIYTSLFTYYDVTPNAVNWSNITTSSFPSGNNGPVTISGIGSPITIEVTFTAGLGLEYSTNNAGSFNSITSGSTLVINNGDNLAFRMSSGSPFVTYTVTIKNVTGDNTTLDTFTCEYFSL